MATNTEMVLGEYGDVEVFAKRIKSLMRGGEKLSINDAMSLAQFSKVTGLNPFIGECWWIPGSGAMIGVAGAIRLDQERAVREGSSSSPNISVCTPQEAGASDFELKDVIAAFRCEINDSRASWEYQKMFSACLESLRGSGVADPVPVAREICGPRPSWVGYGYSTKSEKSRMNKTQLARKRAEADALKKRIIVPFGAQLAQTDINPDYDVDASAEDASKKSNDQRLQELGFSDHEKHHEVGLGNTDIDFPITESAEIVETQELVIESKIPAPKAKQDSRIWSVSQKNVLIEAGKAENDFAAKGMLGLSNLPADATEAEILTWGTAYREKRESVNPDTGQKFLAPEAAKYADQKVSK